MPILQEAKDTIIEHSVLVDIAGDQVITNHYNTNVQAKYKYALHLLTKFLMSHHSIVFPMPMALHGTAPGGVYWALVSNCLRTSSIGSLQQMLHERRRWYY